LALFVVGQIVPVSYAQAISGTKVDIRPVLEYVAENRLPDDVVYVFYRTNTTYQYYAPFYGLDTGNIIMGSQDSRKRVALQNYEDDVLNLVGNKRVWFLFSEVVDCENCQEEDTLSYYLEFINPYGVVIDRYEGFGASAYLYNLSQ
jgi:hypothetical protein